MPDYRAERAPPAGAALRRRAARTRDPRGRRRRLRAGPGRARRRRACAGATRSTCANSTPATSAARSRATWPSTRPRAPSRPAGCCTASPPTQVDVVNVREHVRDFMRTAFDLDATSPSNARRAAPTPARPATDVETDWNPAALAIRAAARDGHRRAAARAPARRHRAHRPRRAAARRRGRARATRRSRSSSTPARACTWPTSPRSARRNGRLGRRDRRDPRLAACAHAFGYRGHCLTKSRRYSTTFKALREAREACVHEQILARSTDATQRAIAGDAETRTAAFEFVGVGHVTAADAFLAASAAARAREHRRLAREERRARSQGYEQRSTEVRDERRWPARGPRRSRACC